MKFIQPFSINTKMLTLSVALVVPCATLAAVGDCFEQAGQRYGIAPVVLRAIAMQESGGDAFALNNSNSNGSVDIGMMQINSRWLDQLAHHGISEQALWEPCINIHVGAWILANNIILYGNTWAAVGAYNAGTAARMAERREAYARKIADRADRLNSRDAADGLQYTTAQ